MTEPLHKTHPTPEEAAPNALPPAQVATSRGDGFSAPATSANSNDAQKSVTPFADGHHHKRHHRTLGLRLFDGSVYWLLVNTTVMGLSIVASYLTRNGPETGFFRKRGKDLVSGFEKIGMSEKNAKMSSLVFWSFFDGTLIAPLVKLLEDRREKIAQWFDKITGHEPKDKSVYAEEPKQSWGSVLGGRIATAAIVITTAIALSRENEQGLSFNDRNFHQRGQKWAKLVLDRPQLAKYFSKIKNVPDLFGITVFEAVYTSICTGSLYFLSRIFADKIGDAKATKENMQAYPPKPNNTNRKIANGNAPTKETSDTKPFSKISNPMNLERMSIESRPQQASL